LIFESLVSILELKGVEADDVVIAKTAKIKKKDHVLDIFLINLYLKV